MSAPAVPTKKGHCPDCNKSTISHVRGIHETQWHEPVDNIRGETQYLILQCAGCERVYFQIDSSDDDQMDEGEWNDEIGGYGYRSEHRLTHFPAMTRRKKPGFIEAVERRDDVLENLLGELYSALNADLRVLAAIGMRTILDRASEIFGIDPAITFEEKMRELVAQGKIGSGEKDTLSSLIDAGNAAAHRAWSPKAEEIDTMMDVLEAFLKRTFILDESMRKLKAAVPAKPSRRTTAPRSTP